MRAGWLVSLIGHIGIMLMTTLVWQTAAEIAPNAGAVVPVEIVDVAVEFERARVGGGRTG